MQLCDDHLLGELPQQLPGHLLLGLHLHPHLPVQLHPAADVQHQENQRRRGLRQVRGYYYHYLHIYNIYLCICVNYVLLLQVQPAVGDSERSGAVLRPRLLKLGVLDIWLTH